VLGERIGRLGRMITMAINSRGTKVMKVQLLDEKNDLISEYDNIRSALDEMERLTTSGQYDIIMVEVSE
jgi:hypothetical protein